MEEFDLTADTIFSPSLNLSIQSYRDWYDDKLSNMEYGDILAVNLPNRLGKTYTTLKHFENEPCKVLYLSDRHDQISEIDNGDKYVHWYGIKKLCENKDDPFIASLIEQGLYANIVCRYCNKTNCNYKKQFEIPDNVIVIAPKEFLQTKRVDEPWDAIIMDENIEKGKKIEVTYPKIPEEVFKKYDVSYKFYLGIKKFIDTTPPDLDINELTTHGSAYSNEIFSIIDQVKAENIPFGENPHVNSLISFLHKLRDTITWISYAQKHGKMDHFYKPYLHYALDLRREYKSKIIILNTSLEKWIYDQITSRSQYDLPEPTFYSADFNNHESLLLQYNHNKRSCNKGAITKNSIFNSRKGSVFGGSYGFEISEMVQRAISYANNKGLKVGIITFKGLKEELEKKFEGKTHIISYFGGHQGSNKFDDVDMLIIIGTYHINPSGLYQTHYKITGEYLKDNPANMRAIKKSINGTQLYLSDNENLNKVKLYKLKEEHGQAIFRSGAHVKAGKIVIAFGFVPEGIEKVLKYRQFKNKEQLLGLLSRIN